MQTLVMALMGCEDGYECSVEGSLTTKSVMMCNVRVSLTLLVCNGLKMCSEEASRPGHGCYVLPDLKLKCDSELKIAFNIQSVAAPMEELTVAEESNEEDPVLPIQSSSITSFTTPMLHTMPITIRDVLIKHI